MNNVICAIAKYENDYINEWCEYHLNLGFSHIYIYDNNPVDYPLVNNYISENIKDKVTFFNKRGITKARFQFDCYTNFYQEYKNKFDWCAFIDLDEFIVLNKWKNINEMCSDSVFNNVDAISLAWLIYDDNNLIERNLQNKVMNDFVHINYDKQKLEQKEIVRGHNNYITVISCHYANYSNGYTYHRVDCDGDINNNYKTHVAPKFTKNAHINHYMTKSLSEFMKYKYKSIDATTGCLNARRGSLKRYYWEINNKTPEKLAWLKEHNYPED